jgi:prophage DNA circulation protein
MVSLADIGTLYGSLIDATWRGLAFNMPDSRHEIGRRALRFFFPGRDDTVFQDLGAKDGNIRISGVLIGDDYVRQVQRMQAAFRQPGPGTLFHPWLGEMQLVLIEPASFTFDQSHLRMAKFEATFAPYLPEVLPPPDTLQALLDALADLRTAARAQLAAALAPVVLALAVIGYVQRFAARMQTWWTEITGIGAGNGSTIAAAAAAPVAALTTSIEDLTPDASYADGVSTALASVSTAIAATSATMLPAAIGAGDATPASSTTDARVTTGILLSAAAQAASGASDPWPAPTLASTTQALILADAIDASTDIAFTSQQEAMTWRDQLVAAIDAATSTAAAIAAAQAVAGGALWRSLIAMRGAVIADMSAVIGRLPAIITVTTPATMPAWLLAHGIAGDDPTKVVSVMLDIIQRNGIRHPALVPAGPLEILQ